MCSYRLSNAGVSKSTVSCWLCIDSPVLGSRSCGAVKPSEVRDPAMFTEVVVAVRCLCDSDCFVKCRVRHYIELVGV